jgi:hypothetical protein
MLCCGALALAGCTDPSSPSSGAETNARESVFDDLTGTLDRAEAVEGIVLDSAAERRRQIDAAEGR